jgi:hypothetical protein
MPIPIAYTPLDLITDAFIEIGATAPGEQPSADEAQWGLRKLNRDVIGVFQAKQAYVWSYAFTQFTLIPNLNPTLIGPSPAANFSTNEDPRPVRIESAALRLNISGGTGPVDLPINIRDRQWWAAQQVKGITTNVPTDLFYDPTSPDGSLYFWPVSNVATPVLLELWQTVSQFDSITDDIGGPDGPGVWPPGYQSAITLTLAELLCPGSKIEPSQQLVAAALQARAAIFGNNAKSPRMCTADSGMPRAKPSGQKQDFNWATGNYPGGRPQ